MNQTKLDELISKWENNFKRVDGPGLPLEEWSAYWAINEFIKDLKSLQSEQEVGRWQCSKCGAKYYETKRECEYICGNCIDRVSIGL